MTLPAEPPNTCEQASDCQAVTAGLNPTLAKTAKFGTLTDGGQRLQVLTACANTEYVTKYGASQQLLVASSAFQLTSPAACTCQTKVCQFTN
jgi:hypothetical protein